MSDLSCRALGRLLVPGLDAGLAGDQAVLQVKHGDAQDLRPARVTAGLHEGHIVPGDHQAPDLVRHVPAAHVGAGLADRASGVIPRPHTSAKYSPIALRPRITFGLLGWSLWSTTCNSASSAYRPSSVAASRSSMPRRSAWGSNDWPVLVIWLVLIWCLPDRRVLRTPSTTIPWHRQRTVKAEAEGLRQARNGTDQGHAAYNDGSHA